MALIARSFVRALVVCWFVRMFLRVCFFGTVVAVVVPFISVWLSLFVFFGACEAVVSERRDRWLEGLCYL